MIGRKAEVDKVTELLADSTCRLLTIVGPGGGGKTRLAIEAAGQMMADFTDGVYFVSLQPIRSPEYLISTVAGEQNVTASARQL